MARPAKPKAQPAKIGRPRREINDAVQARICREMALGKSLRKVLRTKGMPAMTQVMEALDRDPAFQKRYASARARGIELHIDGILDLADSATPDNAAAVRLRVDTRKWLASKLVPRVYGDRLELGGTVAVDVDLDDLSRRERARRVAFVLKQGGDIVASEEAAARPRLPAPAPEPIYRDAQPPDEVRARHPGGHEVEINPLPPRGAQAQSEPQRGHLNAEEQGLAELPRRRTPRSDD